jgi:hypothetical protein
MLKLVPLSVHIPLALVLHNTKVRKHPQAYFNLTSVLIISIRSAKDVPDGLYDMLQYFLYLYDSKLKVQLDTLQERIESLEDQSQGSAGEEYPAIELRKLRKERAIRLKGLLDECLKDVLTVCNEEALQDSLKK